MYKYNSKDVLKIFRGGSTIYDVCNEVVPKLFNNNEIGYWYDPDDLDSTKLKWRRNLFTETEFRNGITDLPIKGGSFSFVPFAGLTQGTGVQIDMNAGGTYVYKTYAHKAGVIYNFSAYIRMQDGSAPVLGQTGSGADVDVCVVIKGNTAAPSITTLTNLGGGLYRVSVVINNSLSASYFGFVKYVTNSTRPVIVSGYQLEESTDVTSYQPITNFNSEFINTFPKHTLFQDSSGTIPVTNGNQPVGLILDKSKGINLSTEKIINGNFSNGLTGWVNNGSYWSIINERAYHALGDVLNALEQAITATTIATYLEFTAEVLTPLNTAQAQFVPSGTTFNFTTGTHRVPVPIGTTIIQFKRVPSMSAEFYIDNVSVKTILGNHAFQINSSSRPTLRLSPILGNNLVINGMFDNNVNNWAWPSKATFVAQNGKGILTATENGVAQVTQTIPNIVGKTVEVSCKFSNKTGTGSAIIAFWSGTATTGSAGSTSTSGTLTFTVSIPADHAGILVIQISSATTGDTIEFDDIVVKEVKNYYTDCNYLEFDGIDDFLVSTSINLSTIDKLSLFTGIRKSSDAATGTVFEFSTNKNTNNGVFSLFAPLDIGVTQIAYTSKGTIERAAVNNNIVAPASSVISIQSSISGNISSLKINGSTVSNIGGQGTGNYGNFPLYIGIRSGSALPFNGRIYSLIGVSRLTTASENSVIEKAIALKLGITL